MTHPIAYASASRKLDHVETVKRQLGDLLKHLCDASRSGMYISAAEYQNALACIHETVDELFWDECREARRIIASCEQAWHRGNHPS